MELFILFGLFLTISAQLHGSISDTPLGQSVSIRIGDFIGTPDHNIAGGVSASGSVCTSSFGNCGKPNPIAFDAGINYNINGHGLGLSKRVIPGVGSSLTESANVNLFNDNVNKIDAGAFHTKTNFDNGFSFDKYGGKLDYNHISGHGASVGVSSIPNYGSSLDVGVNKNLWTSDNGLSSFGVGASVSHNLHGVNRGNTNFGANLGFNHKF